jgi:hypothetical protein
VTTSSDGYLTVTADTSTASNLITVNFSAGLNPATMNLVANPNSETAVAVVATTNATVARTTAQAHTGTACSAISAITTAGVVEAQTPTGVNACPVIGGQTYMSSFWMRPASTARTVVPVIAWWTAAGAQISLSAGSGVAETGGAWKYYTFSATAPSNAAYASVYSSVASPVATEVHYIDDIQLEPGSSATAYCDGSQPGCYWSGPVNASISVRPPVTGVSVSRADGTVVRGLYVASAPGGVASGIDHEAPLGVAVVYNAIALNSVGSIVLSSTTATATISGITAGWLKSLTFPSLSVAFTTQTAPDWDFDSTQSVNTVVGRSDLVAVDDVRQYPSGSLTVVTTTTAQQAALQTLLSSPGPYLVQWATGANEPDRFVNVGKVTVTRPTKQVTSPDRYFTLPIAAVARPTAQYSRASRPGHSYANSGATWALYSNRTSTYGSR